MFCCKDSIHKLLDFLDGELSSDESAQLQQHLEACPPCKDFMATYRATPGMCKKALAKKMPEELSAKLSQLIKNRIAAK